VAASKSTTEADAAAAGEILGRAEAKLQLLRTGSGQDFPLLNEATRLGEQGIESRRTVQPLVLKYAVTKNICELGTRRSACGRKFTCRPLHAVQQVEGLVMRMPEADPVKGIWREYALLVLAT
jgi:hypothetical protein